MKDCTTFSAVEPISPTYSKALYDVSLFERSELKEFKKLYSEKLRFQSEQNLKVFLNVIMKTGFLNQLLINLSCLRGLEGRKEITFDEIKKITEIWIKYCTDGKETDDSGKNILIKLLDSKIFKPGELYNCIVIHQQRNYFNQKWFKTLNDRCQTLIDSLEKPKELTKKELEKISEIAVFGATYSTMKTRLETGLKYYETNKINNLEKIYLLTGRREIYLSELQQLKIIANIQSLKEKSKEKKIDNIAKLIDFVATNSKDSYSTCFDKARLVEMLNKIKEASEDCKFIKEKFTETNSLKELLEQIKLIQEKDLFLLAFSEVASELKNKELKNKMELVYSEQTNGVGIIREQAMPARANTKDTLLELLKKLKNNKENFNKILFVSNGPNILQQFGDVLSVSDGNGQFCLKAFEFGNIKNIAATCFALQPYITKLLNKDKLISQKSLNKEFLEKLNDIEINKDKAYELGLKQKLYNKTISLSF